MAAIDEINLGGLDAQGEWISASVRQAFAAQLWGWIHANADREVYTLRLWVITKTLRVRDLHPVFTLLFGPDPSLARGA